MAHGQIGLQRIAALGHGNIERPQGAAAVEAEQAADILRAVPHRGVLSRHDAIRHAFAFADGFAKCRDRMIENGASAAQDFDLARAFAPHPRLQGRVAVFGLPAAECAIERDGEAHKASHRRQAERDYRRRRVRLPNRRWSWPRRVTAPGRR